MEHTIVTNLDLVTSKRVLDKAFESYAAKYNQYNPSFGWKTPTLACFGFNVGSVKLDGALVVDAGRILVKMNVPFIARPFQGKAIQIIESEVQLWVEKEKNGKNG